MQTVVSMALATVLLFCPSMKTHDSVVKVAIHFSIP